MVCEHRTNGFQAPLHPLQVASWVVFAADILVFAVFCLPLISGALSRIACSVLFGLSTLGVLLSTFRATRVNPVDRSLIVPPKVDPDNTDFLYCTTCESYVLPRSKHCKLCRKCVDIFDHHCKWMNTCVGKENYPYFIVSIGCVSVMTAVETAVASFLLYQNVAGNEVSELAKSFYMVSADSLTAIFIVLLVINAPLLCLDLQLVVLHIYLARNDLTTYEYIMTKRSQQKEKSSGSTGKSKYEMGPEFVPQGRRLERGIKTLPAVLDWIVYKGRRGSYLPKPAEKYEEHTSTMHVDVMMKTQSLEDST